MDGPVRMEGCVGFEPHTALVQGTAASCPPVSKYSGCSRRKARKTVTHALSFCSWLSSSCRISSPSLDTMIMLPTSFPMTQPGDTSPAGLFVILCFRFGPTAAAGLYSVLPMPDAVPDHGSPPLSGLGLRPLRHPRPSPGTSQAASSRSIVFCAHSCGSSSWAASRSITAEQSCSTVA